MAHNATQHGTRKQEPLTLRKLYAAQDERDEAAQDVFISQRVLDHMYVKNYGTIPTKETMARIEEQKKILAAAKRILAAAQRTVEQYKEEAENA